MIKTELHCHTTGPSVCADVTDEQLVLEHFNAGYGAIVITNHINGTFNNYPAPDYKGKVDYFFSSIDRIKEIANKKGIKVFYGAEIVANTDDGIHQEFILIGFDKEFLYNNNLVRTYNQKELFELAEKNGLFMFQTHPFRVGEKTGDPKYMHGAESFNCHYHHDNNNEKAKDFCQKNNLVMLSGNDYHHSGQPLIAGIYLPEEIENEKQLAQYLLSCQPQIIEDQKACLKSRKDYLASQEQVKENL